MTCHYPDLGSVSDWLKQISLEACALCAKACESCVPLVQNKMAAESCVLCINTIEDTSSRYILHAKTKSSLEGINLRSELPFEVKLSETREVKYLCQTWLWLLKKGKDFWKTLNTWRVNCSFNKDLRKAHRLLIAHHKDVNNAFISGEPVTRPTVKTDLYDTVEFGISGISYVFNLPSILQ